jgi:menaquinone-9 beta-reductase
MSAGGTSKPVDYDVVVIGAGPAGTASAITLSQSGLRVALVDQKCFPRDKVCGDFVSPIAVHQLRVLGVARKHGISRSNRIRDAAVFSDGKHLLTQAIPTEGMPVGRVIPRMTLDKVLLDRAREVGAKVRTDCRMTSFERRSGYVRVLFRQGHSDGELTARILIGADGSNSVVARLLRGNRPDEDDRIVAVRGYFEAVEGPSDRADLYFDTSSFPGYCWLFPTGNRMANVGLGVLRKTVPEIREHLRAQLDRLIETDTALARRLRVARPVGTIVGWPLTTYNGDDPVVGDRVILVGDAAGLINPLNGEGIQYALLSGTWAAEAVMGCVALGDFSEEALRPYAQRIAVQLGSDFALTRALVQLIRNQALNPVWLKALHLIIGKAALDEEYARVAGGVLAGIIPARQVFKLDIIRKTVEHGAVQASMQATGAPLTTNAILRTGINATQFAIEVASTMLKDPSGTERWALGLAARARDVLTSSNRSLRTEEGRANQNEQVCRR